MILCMIDNTFALASVNNKLIRLDQGLGGFALLLDSNETMWKVQLAPIGPTLWVSNQLRPMMDCDASLWEKSYD